MALMAAVAAMDGPDERRDTVAAARAGDLEAFELLMRQHERLVLATALRLTGNMEDAQDISQEVFLRLYKNLGKVQAEAALPAAVTQAERRRVLEMSLRLLPEKERAALVLRDLEGLSTEEVARALGSSEATVRSQVSKARAKVHDFVERYFSPRGRRQS